MTAYFDGIASDYDLTFTNSETGRLQRGQVWQYLLQNILGRGKLNILEFNCGTGEDAIWLSQLGHKVLATDLSEKMIESARSKGSTSDSGVEFRVLDLKHASVQSGGNFDLVFSNFGGLNCLSPQDLDTFLKTLPSLLTGKGTFIAVLMPNFCFIESLYFLLKFKFNDILRRRRMTVAANGSGQMPVWYYSPAQIQSRLPAKMRLTGIRGIGTFVPPSYLEEKIKSRPGLLSALGKADDLLSNLSFPAYFSDHYLIDIRFEP